MQDDMNYERDIGLSGWFEVEGDLDDFIFYDDRAQTSEK